MRTIRLDLDSLSVDSFATDVAGTPTGTARANAPTQQPAHTCDYTCGSQHVFLCCTG